MSRSSAHRWTISSPTGPAVTHVGEGPVFVSVDAFVSHKLSLDDVNRGFELMEAQDGIRSVIDFGK